MYNWKINYALRIFFLKKGKNNKTLVHTRKFFLKGLKDIFMWLLLCIDGWLNWVTLIKAISNFDLHSFCFLCCSNFHLAYAYMRTHISKENFDSFVEFQLVFIFATKIKNKNKIKHLQHCSNNNTKIISLKKYYFKIIVLAKTNKNVHLSWILRIMYTK